MEFGISFGALYADPQTYLRYSVEGEKLGYSYLFYPDSQTLYRDPFVTIGAVSTATSRVKLGTLVSSVYTRHPTVLAASAITAHEVSGGRFALVVGAGDSSVRRIGIKPTPVQEFEKSVKHLQELIAGKEFDMGTGRFGIRFARHRVPVYVAATGKRMLGVSGRVADGSVIMVGPALTKWAVERVRESCEEAGLDFEKRELFWCGFCVIHEDREYAKKLVKPSVSWFCINYPDLVKMLGVDFPRDFWDKVEKFRNDYARYDLVHSQTWTQAVEDASFIPDELADRMALAGDLEEIEVKLRDIEKMGISKVIIRPPAHELWYDVFKRFGENVIDRLG
ncbi:MAG: LLM class flavin-dependent oxidoreductase [Candidatus Caldarchaeum sp.]